MRKVVSVPSLLALITLSLTLGLAACDPSIARPARTQVQTSDYVPVPGPPRASQVEIIPPSPTKAAVWVDGTWEYVAERFVWRPGAWVIPPLNGAARYARWVVVRRVEDGQLFFAPSSWRDGSGKVIEDPPSLGPTARARSRIGGPAVGEPEE